MKRIVGLFFLAGLCSQAVFAQGQQKLRFVKPTKKDKAHVARLLEGLTKNRSRFPNFVTFVESEIRTTRVALPRPSILERTSIYLRAADRDLRRFDDKLRVMRDGKEFSSDRWKSVVQNGTKMRQYFDDRLYAEYQDLTSELVDPPVVIDPWTASIANPVEFGNGKAGDDYESKYLGLSRLSGVVRRGGITIARFKVKSLFTDLFFDEQVGGLPVSCTFSTNVGTDDRPVLAVIGTIETNWERSKVVENGWLPIHVQRSCSMGQAKARIVVETLLRFEWCLEPNFPAGAFDPSKLAADRLRGAIRRMVD